MLSNPDTKETLHSNCINPAHHLRGACLNVSLYNISTNSWPSSGKLKILFYSDFSDKFIPGGWLFRDNLFYSNLSIFCSYCVFMQSEWVVDDEKKKTVRLFSVFKVFSLPVPSRPGTRAFFQVPDPSRPKVINQHPSGPDVRQARCIGHFFQCKAPKVRTACESLLSDYLNRNLLALLICRRQC